MFFLIPLCLILAGTFIWQEKEEKYVYAVILKGTASLCFVILGFLNCNGSGTARLLCCGLAVGAIADVLLNLRYVFAEKGKLVFLIGILVFLSGHLLYLAAIVPLASAPIVCVLAGAVLSALLLKWIFGRIEAQMAFSQPSYLYASLKILSSSFKATRGSSPLSKIPSRLSTLVKWIIFLIFFSRRISSIDASPSCTILYIPTHLLFL